MPEPIRVVLIDPHCGMRLALRSLLDDEAGLALVGEGAGTAAVEHALVAGGVDVVVADERVAGRTSEAARAVLAELSSIAAVVVTGTGDASVHAPSHRAAGAGYWGRLGAIDGLGNVIRTVAAARRTPPRVLRAVGEPFTRAACASTAPAARASRRRGSAGPRGSRDRGRSPRR